MTVIDLAIKEKVYKKKGFRLSLLNDFRLQIGSGECLAVIGESGAGKTTLLNILGLLDGAYEGSYELFGKNVAKLSETEKANLRNENIGFVLQESALIQSLNIEQNIRLPFLYANKNSGCVQLEDYEHIIDSLGIRSILKKKPLECSGGERSRAVFARAIVMRPKLILSDEPTASLDEENKERLLQLLFEINKKHAVTLITVTHDLQVAHAHDRIIRIERKV